MDLNGSFISKSHNKGVLQLTGYLDAPLARPQPKQWKDANHPKKINVMKPILMILDNPTSYLSLFLHRQNFWKINLHRKMRKL